MNTFGVRRAMAAAGLAAAIVAGISTPASATPDGIEQLTRDLAQACRFPRTAGVPTPEEACSEIDGRVYSEEAMDAYEASWTHQALALQARLDDTTPLRDGLFPATHNSFNTASQPPTLSGLDHNQVASLTDQLRMDMRGLEIDVHWAPSPEGTPATGFKAPVTCHAQDQAFGPLSIHIGCTAEQTLSHRLDELAAWLDAHPNEFLLLYLENALENDPVAHDAAAAAIAAHLGDRVYRPPAGQPCAAMPTGLSERQILDSTGNPQVLIVGNCGAGGAWGTWVHERDEDGGTWTEDKSDVGEDFDCDAEPAPTTFRRFYEDSTWLSHTVEPTGLGSPGEITVAETAAMVACNVNLFGFDQLVPADERLPALVWSWANGAPAAADTLAFRSGSAGRFLGTADATASRPYACRVGTGWSVTAGSGPWGDGELACDAEFGSAANFAVPATAAEHAALGAAAAGADVWLDYAVTAGAWATDTDPSGGGGGAQPSGLARASQTPAGGHLPPQAGPKP